MKRRTNSVYLALVILLTLAVVGASLPGVRAQSPNRVGLVVRFGDGSSITRCVEFSEPQISGYDALMRSGLNVVAAYFSGEGTAICKIEHEGCPVESCLTCDVPNYWAYWHLVDGAWSYSQAGASGYTVHPGDVEGWSWGAGDPPPVIPFDQICAPPPTNTPPATATDTPIPPTAAATSPPATATPVPATATAPPATIEVWFRLDDNPISSGDCTNVRWDTANALEVYLDGERVGLNGGREVCPTTAQEFQLRVVSAKGEQIETLVLGVAAAGTAPSPAPASEPTALSSPLPPATATSPPAFASPTSVPSAFASPTAQPAATVSPSPSPSPTPARAASRPSSAFASPTPALQPTERPADQPPSIIVPIGYIAFSLIVGGLLGWLVFVITQRR